MVPDFRGLAGWQTVFQTDTGLLSIGRWDHGEHEHRLVLTAAPGTLFDHDGGERDSPRSAVNSAP
jgi:hypothetical protein